MPIALLALTLSTFAIGTTEFVIVGLLPTIGADLGGLKALSLLLPSSPTIQAGLLAKADCQPASLVNDTPLSRASPLVW